METEQSLALRAAKLYYYQSLTTEEIAKELGLSRPKVSRLLSLAKRQGIVQIRIFDPSEDSRSLANSLKTQHKLRAVHIVPVPDNATEAEALERVATFAGLYLNTFVQDNTVVGLAWGTTLTAISKHLVPKATTNSNIVQLNGSGTVADMSNPHIEHVFSRFGKNYGARVHQFPVPAFFDYSDTKIALWRERSIKKITQLQQQATVLMYSVGAIHASVPSYVYEAGYLEPKDHQELRRENVMGDIATVFFRQDGSFDNIPLNTRASGPDLTVIRQAENAICVVAGRSKAQALKAALAGSLLKELIVDEPTARLLLT